MANVNNGNVRVRKTNILREASLEESNGISVLTVSLYLDDFDVSFTKDGTDYFATVEDRLLWTLQQADFKLIPRLGAALKRKTGNGLFPGTLNGLVLTPDTPTVANPTWVNHVIYMGIKNEDNSITNLRSFTVLDTNVEGNAMTLDVNLKNNDQTANYTGNVVFTSPAALNPVFYFLTKRAAVPYGNGVKIILQYENWMGTRERVFVDRSIVDSRVSYFPDNTWGRVNKAYAWETDPDLGAPSVRIYPQKGKLVPVEYNSEVRSLQFAAPSVSWAWEKIHDIFGTLNAVNSKAFFGEIPARWQLLPPDVIHIGDTSRVLVNLLFRKSPILDKPDAEGGVRGDPWWPIVGYLANDGRQVSEQFDAPRWKVDSIDDQTLGLLDIDEMTTTVLPSTAAPEWIQNGWARIKAYPDADFNNALDMLDYSDPEATKEIYIDDVKMMTEVGLTPDPAPEPPPAEE